MLLMVGYVAAIVASIAAGLLLCAIIASAMVRRRLARSYPELFEYADPDSIVYRDELQAAIVPGGNASRSGGMMRSTHALLVITYNELMLVPSRMWLALAFKSTMLLRVPRSAVEVVAADRQQNTVTLSIPMRGLEKSRTEIAVTPHDIEELLVVLGKDRIF